MLFEEASCSLAIEVYHGHFDEKHNNISSLQSNYTEVLGLLHELDCNDYYLNRIRLPRLTDKQLMALNLAAEALGIDSERYLFNRLPQLRGKIERSIYNRVGVS